LRIRISSPCGPRPPAYRAGSPLLGSLRWAPAPWTFIGAFLPPGPGMAPMARPKAISTAAPPGRPGPSRCVVPLQNHASPSVNRKTGSIAGPRAAGSRASGARV